MKAVLALFAITIMLIGRILTFKASKAAWESNGASSPLDKINTDPKLRTLYRLGQGHYLFGAALFAVCFFL